MYRRIRDLREDSDLTQKSLADYLSCSQVCYSNYETGKRDVPSDVLTRLARFYHTEIVHSAMFSHGCEGDAARQRCFCPCTAQGGKAAPLALHESKGIFSFAKENIPFGTPRERL